MKIKMLIINLLAIIFLLLACTDQEQAESRTIQQIQEEEGIPVSVTKLEHQSFVINYSYNSNLSGIKETTVNASIADRVDEVYVKVGDYVDKDQVLLTFPEDNPMGQYRQAKAVYENSLADYERMKILYETGGLSRSDLDKLKTGLIVNKANYDAAAKAIKVKAPFAGTVTKIFVRETESVGIGESLATITILDQYKAKVWVTENELRDIRIGNNATALALGKLLPGRVVQVAQSIDTTRQAFIVDLEFDNPQNLTISGILADIDITAYLNDETIVIPRQYIHNPEQEDSYVYVLYDDKAVRRKILTARNDGLRYEIVGGLTEGDWLITQGTNSVSDGSLVKVIAN